VWPLKNLSSTDTTDTSLSVVFAPIYIFCPNFDRIRTVKDTKRKRRGENCIINNTACFILYLRYTHCFDCLLSPSSTKSSHLPTTSVLVHYLRTLITIIHLTLCLEEERITKSLKLGNRLLPIHTLSKQTYTLSMRASQCCCLQPSWNKRREFVLSSGKNKLGRNREENKGKISACWEKKLCERTATKGENKRVFSGEARESRETASALLHQPAVYFSNFTQDLAYRNHFLKSNQWQKRYYYFKVDSHTHTSN